MDFGQNSSRDRAMNPLEQPAAHLFILFYQKRYQSVTPKEGEYYWSVLSNDFAEDHLAKILIVPQLFCRDITYKRKHTWK